MAEFDDKLNSILSNPDAMAQIMQLAQSLSGSTEGGRSAVGPPPPPPRFGRVLFHNGFLRAEGGCPPHYVRRASRF